MIIVPSEGATVTAVTLNDTLQAVAGTDLNGNTLLYEIDGTSTLQSLVVGYDIEVVIGLLAAGSLSGTGSITGPTDATGGNLPSLANDGALDINGTIGIMLDNEGQLTVAAGERLDVIADLFSISGSISVAATGELDLDSPNSAFIPQITVAGRLNSAAPRTTLQQVTNTGTIDITAGTLALAGSLSGAGTIIVESGATLSLAAAQAVSGTIVLAAGAALVVSQDTKFTGTLQGPAGATIDLVNLVATGAQVANGAISIATPSGTVSIGENGLTNGTMLVVSTDGSGGSLIAIPALAVTPVSPTPVVTTPTPTGSAPGTSTAVSGPGIYRFFDQIHGTQFLTASSAEATSLQTSRPDLKLEGIGLTSVAPTDTSGAPVFRFFDTVFGTHFYTASASEQANVVATRPDLTYEGIGFYEHTTQQQGDVPVYRFFEQTNGTHFYTSSAAEKAQIVATRPDLTLENVSFYAPS